MTETAGTPARLKDDERIANEARTKALREAGDTAEKEIGQGSTASEALDRATASVGKDEA